MLKKTTSRHWITCLLLFTSWAISAQIIAFEAVPDTSTVLQGDTFHVTVHLDNPTPDTSVIGLDISIQFDTNAFEILAVNELVPFQFSFVNPGNESGQIDYIASNVFEAIPPGSFDVLDIEILALQPVSCALFDFMPISQVIYQEFPPLIIIPVLDTAFDFYASVGQVLNDTICDNESFAVGNQNFNETGTYDIMLQASDGCDSLVRLNLTVFPTEMKSVSGSICSGDSVFVHGQWYTSAGTFTDTIPATIGCDTLLTIDIIETPVDTITVEVSICPGDSVFVHGHWYDSVGTYTGIIPAIIGCDTLLTIEITENPVETITMEVSICTGDSVFVHGQWYDAVGTYIDVIPSTTGCDSLLLIQILESTLDTMTIEENLCGVDSINLYGTWYNVVGAYTDTIQAATGCDTLLMINITGAPVDTITVVASFCAGDSVFVHDKWYSSGGTFIEILPALTGCDTILLVHVTEDQLPVVTINGDFCAGDSTLVFGVWYSEAGTFLDTIPDEIGGCDVILSIVIREDPLVTKTITSAFCTGDSVLLFGRWYDTIGTYTDTIPAITGCDTIMTIIISEVLLPTKAIDLSYCAGDSVEIYGNWYSASGTYADTIPDLSGGCDTIVSIEITEIPAESDTIQEFICAGDSITVLGDWFSEAGIFQVVRAGLATNGCDSVYTVTITESPVSQTAVDSIICNGDSVIVGGQVIKMHGIYQIIVPAANGCDSIITIDLTVLDCNKTFVDPNAPGKQTGATWNDAFHTIEEAIAFASFSGIDSVFVIQGAHKIGEEDRNASFVLQNTVKIYGGFTGTENFRSERPEGMLSVLTGDIGIQGADEDDVYHVVRIDESCTDCELDGFIIRDGNANGADPGNQQGAGLLARGIGLVDYVTIQDCIAINGAAAILSTGENAALIVKDCNINMLASPILPTAILNINGGTITFKGFNTVTN